jgi:polysaccharide biosynthesis PFTS motif protein
MQKIFRTRHALSLLTILFFKISRILRSQALRRILRPSDLSIPEIVVLSLSKDQLYMGKSSNYLKDFFREERFENPSGQLLIETRLFQIPSINRRRTTPSAPFYLFSHCLSISQHEEVSDLFRIGIETIYETANIGEVPVLKTFYSLFELSTWCVLRREEITIVTTQSTLKQLPIPFCIPENLFTRKMMWYSTNSQPISESGNETNEALFAGNLDELVDMHYVWDSNAVEHLRINGITRSKAVGSILFIKNLKTEVQRENFTIAYFDVTPLEKSDSFYSAERMCQNISQLVMISKQFSNDTGVKVDLLVKPKRTYTKIHSRRYIELLKLMKESKQIEIIKPTENLYSLIREVDCVVGCPFTSPVVLAKELGIPAAFLDFFKDEYLLPGVENELLVLRNTEQLSAWLSEILESKPIQGY